MKTIVAVALPLIMFGAAAMADEPVSEDEGKKIQAALQEWGCNGGEMEKEPGPLIYEIDDADCSDGEYDIRLDRDFDVILIARH
jgi:hypothetical protein